MNERPTHIDLFSGIGGFALAARWAGFRTVAFCEIDPYCQKVLAKNFGAVADTERVSIRRESGNVDRSKREDCGRSKIPRQLRDSFGSGRPVITRDIFEFDGTAYQGCDLLTGGFPCQPFSVAGKRGGAADDRNLWPEMLRVIKEARPAWVLGENVPGIIAMELDNVLSQLESIGYACRPFVIPACAVDARHRRDRVWIVGRNVSNADTAGHEERRRSEHLKAPYGAVECAGEAIPDAASRSEQQSRTQCDERRLQDETMSGDGDSRHWLTEPDVGRVAHGIPSRVDRLRGLGNAIVPQVAFEILREIRAQI